MEYRYNRREEDERQLVQGRWVALSNTPTPGAQNVFDDPTPTPPTGETMTVDAWSGLADVTTVDAEGEFGAKEQGGDHTDGNLSGRSR